MKAKDLYIIEITKYKKGKHHIEFDITNDLIEKYQIENVNAVDVKADVDMIVDPNFLQLEISLNGTINIQCGRCLDYYNHEINHQTHLTVDFGDQTDDLTLINTQITINKKENNLILDKHFYDYISISMPYKPAHPEENGKSQCNPEMLEQLQKYSNNTTAKQTDPRWDKLKHIFNNN